MMLWLSLLNAVIQFRGMKYPATFRADEVLQFIHKIALILKDWMRTELWMWNWNVKEKHAYPVHIKVVCTDRKGVLTEVSSIISSFDINISYAQVETIDMIATCNFVIDVNDLHQLNQIFSAIRQLKFVKSIERMRQY